MVYYGREEKERVVFSYVRKLAQSQGSYGRLLHEIEYAKEFYPKDYEEFMDEATQHCGSMLEFVMWYEG